MRRLFLTTLSASCMATAVQATPTRVDIAAGALSEAVNELARETGAEILFDPALLEDQRTERVYGELTIEGALQRLLARSSLGFRRTAENAFVLVAQDDPAYPEILVQGRRTQNADIRRSENDIQPYRVASRDEIERSQRSNVEEFVRARNPLDTSVRSVSFDSDPGSARSGFDLRGLGRQRTLVLVDGRRLPSVPFEFAPIYDQPDLNGIPLGAVERIETLTGTAGGIYGPGAIGGIVNVVLRRDYRGGELSTSVGMAEAGRAKQLRVEARFGFTPDDGRTDIMLLGAHRVSQPLLVGDQDFAAKARRKQFANDPAAYLASIPVGESIGIFSLAGDLKLDPEFGGTSISSPYTYLPIGLSGDRDTLVSTLQANAGKLTFGSPPDQSGAYRYLVPNPRVTSGLLSVRHRVSGALEVYLDALLYRNSASSTPQNTLSGGSMRANAPTNPFAQAIYVHFPTPLQRSFLRNDLDVGRMTAGLIVRMGSGWSAAVDHAEGFAKRTYTSENARLSSRFTGSALSRGIDLQGLLPAPDPLGSWSDFLRQMSLYLVNVESRSAVKNRFADTSLRIAGPLATLPGGPLAFTMLLEERNELVRPGTGSLDFAGTLIKPMQPGRGETVRSGYAEVRAPLVDADAAPGPLRGLETQLAIRYDRTSARFAAGPNLVFAAPGGGDLTRTVLKDGLAFTFGGLVRPTPAVMLRASIATGQLPPTVQQLATQTISVQSDAPSSANPPDPQRGGRPILSEGFVVRLFGGSSSIKPERARTLAIGAVLNPDGGGAPRVSVDYSRIARTRGIVPFADTALLLGDNSAFPGRLKRASLTPADVAAGYAAGRVIEVDMTAFNGGRTVVEAVDATFDWQLPTEGSGEIRLYGSATWLAKISQSRSPGHRPISRLNYVDSPLEWRGNAGVAWGSGPVSVDLNAQYLGSYRVTFADDRFASSSSQFLRYQGRSRVASQVYLDLSARRRFELAGGAGASAIDVSFGIQNLLDKLPPTVISTTDAPYSTYGDPRGRRFELMLAAQF